METGIIDQNTIPNPQKNYGKSKLQAEKLILQLDDLYFKVAILRPPMVYGEGCKGNYPIIKKFILKSPIFPKIENQRSMIYIFNLCEFIRMVIDNEDAGLFFPQNDEYVCSSNMAVLIAKANNKKIILTSLFNPFIKTIKSTLSKKVFGDLIYDKKISNYHASYSLFKFEDTFGGR